MKGSLFVNLNWWACGLNWLDKLRLTYQVAYISLKSPNASGRGVNSKIKTLHT